ncbi:Os06g0546000 [Oryza sativa Japonica Group]|uniref:Os06g0546000 protein n=2 Tax=Oryza sativa subsp. japonica TaxID=39947 RepID=Q0DBP1_ORYSJ|nr:Os06g0546000 [Oryza sativa Japonica Group]BAS98151.1 Os06g0546000 [Oryza sativa Japonica Group]|eukprot:NP_001057818.1 Os06g0546000 [Oryza sativa Japonica Group]
MAAAPPCQTRHHAGDRVLPQEIETETYVFRRRMASVGKWVSLYACSSSLSASPPPKSQSEYATMSSSNLMCSARYLLGSPPARRAGTSSMLLPNSCLSISVRIAPARRSRWTSREPARWISGTNLSAWKLHLHRSLCKNRRRRHEQSRGWMAMVLLSSRQVRRSRKMNCVRDLQMNGHRIEAEPVAESEEMDNAILLENWEHSFDEFRWRSFFRDVHVCDLS